MMKKGMALLLAATMAGGMLAGCSGQSGTEQAETGQTEAASTQSEGGETAAETEGEGKTVIQFWHSMSGTKNDLIDEMVAKFNETHDDIEVVATYQGDYWESASKAQAAISAGENPDILQMGADHVSIFASEDGLLADLSPYMEASGISQDDLVDAFSWDYKIDGKLFALPFGRSTPILYVNMDMLKEVGKEVPTTWEEWHDVCQALVQKDENGEYTRYGFSMPYDTLYWFMIVAQAGGQFINDERTGLGCVDDGTMYEAFKFYQDMHNDVSLYFGPVTDSDVTCQQMFLEGKCGMYLSSCANLIGVQNAADFDMQTAFVPKGKEQVVPSGGCSVVMMEASPNKDAAWEFMRWVLQDPDGGLKFCMETGYLPYTHSMAESEPYQEMWAENPSAKTVYDQLEYASDKGHRVPQVGNIMTDLQVCIQAIMYDNEDVQESINVLAEAVADLMEE